MFPRETARDHMFTNAKGRRVWEHEAPEKFNHWE